MPGFLAHSADPFFPTARLRSPISVRVAISLLVGIVSLLAAASEGWARPASRVFLNGVLSPVWFNDGDSFAVLAGPYAGTKARLAGYNTLESFGNVHKWGDWKASELYVNAKMATLNARRGTWRCTSDLQRDGYGRILWDCPDLAVDQIRKGLAHAMTVTKLPSPDRYIAAQKAAIAEKRGMWAKGVPKYILTSAHSNDEGYDGTTYNRTVSTEDGHSEKWIHLDMYKTCQWVCHEAGACHLYVPFSRRYGQGAATCLHD
ncbi:MAG: thermonuclease family protein [Myxococcota bacterium]